MASFRKRNNLWQVQVRKKGIGSIAKSFDQKKDARAWAKEQERLMQTGGFRKKDIRHKTIGDLMIRYLAEVTPFKQQPATETRRIRRLLREYKLMETYLLDALPPKFARFRDKRLADGVRATQYDLVLLRHAWNIACIEWGWQLGDNPVSKIRFPKNNPSRERRLRNGEYETLLEVSSKMCWYMKPMIICAIETAMRRSELLRLEWNYIYIDKRKALLPITKNGRSRWVPLSSLTLSILKDFERTSRFVFPVSDNAFRLSWQRLRKKTGMLDLTFHDLRHEAISRLFEAKRTVPEVMAISGHRTSSQLFRYVQIDALQ